MSLRNDNLEVVLGGWIEGRRRSDADLIARHLHPDVVWQGLRSDLVCRGREQVLENVRNGAHEPDVEALELIAGGDQVMLGVHSPALTDIAGEHLDGRIYNVFTIADGLIVRMDEYRTRDEAREAMRVRHEASERTGEPVSRTPDTPVDDLIPFVHVHDVARSIAFYELLGFAVTDTYSIGDRLDWAALESAEAKLMLAHAEEPIHPRDQAILFYLYTRDLQALQTHLRAHGVPAGAIRDGSPGPKAEMRVTDPEGYVLMIAQRHE
jgi:ketosteroid isomerase-like protein